MPSLVTEDEILTIKSDTSRILNKISRFLAEKDIPSFIVGGFIRDTLLGRATDDIDIAVGEVMSLAVNRKRGIWLAVIGGAAFALSYVIRILTFGEVPTVGFDMAIDLAGLIIGVYMAVNRLY